MKLALILTRDDGSTETLIGWELSAPAPQPKPGPPPPPPPPPGIPVIEGFYEAGGNRLGYRGKNILMLPARQLTLVTIRGRGFGERGRVEYAGNPVMLHDWTDTEIVMRAPVWPGHNRLCRVRVVRADGEAVEALAFAIEP